MASPLGERGGCWRGRRTGRYVDEGGCTLWAQVRVLAGSLFESQPLVRAGALGLGAGVALIALVVRMGDDFARGTQGAPAPRLGAI